MTRKRGEALLLKPGQPDLSLYGPKPLLEGYAKVFMTRGFHPTIKQIDPHGQAIPGGDGAIYETPLDLRLLLLDRSWVIAEGFHVHEATSAQRRPPLPNQN